MSAQSILGPQVTRFLTPPRGPESAGRADQLVRRVPADRRAGRPVPPLDGLLPVPPAGADQLRAVRAEGLPLPARPGLLRPQLHTAGPGAARRPRPLHGDLRTRPPGRLPVGGVRPPGGDRLQGPALPLRGRGQRRGPGRGGQVRRLRDPPPDGPGVRPPQPHRHARLPGPAPAPAGLRPQRLRPGSRQADAPGGVEPLVPRADLGPVRPAGRRRPRPAGRGELGRPGEGDQHRGA